MADKELNGVEITDDPQRDYLEFIKKTEKMRKELFDKISLEGDDEARFDEELLEKIKDVIAALIGVRKEDIF